MDVGGNIISSLGAGSGIDSSSIVEQLVDIERTLKQTPIDEDRELFEAQLSDYGLMRSALSLLQESADLLADDESFGSKNATFTDSDAFIPSNLTSEAPTGDFTFEVTAIAQAQSLVTNAGFTTINDAVGKGVLTFSFGEWDTVTPPTPPETFTLDTTRDAFNITIDDTNNTLTGLRDAINAADEGVQASIINDGTDYRLVITSESGATNELQITVVEDGGSPTNTDANDLSRFAFDAGVAGANQQMEQTQVGADASLIVNGLTVTRSTNVIDDVIEGFEFTLAKADPGTVITVNIFDDKDAAETAVRDFVDAYNAFFEALEPLIGVDEETEENGSLNRDTTSRSITTAIRNAISAAIPGLSGDFTALASVGIRTNADNTLRIEDDILEAALEDNFDELAALFSPEATSSTAGITINSFGDDTVAGSYAVVVTQDPVKGDLVGVASAGTLLADLVGAAATDYDFTIVVDGVSSGTISLTPGTYTNDTLAAHIQSQINNDTALAAVSADVDVVWDTDHFEITSRSYGSSSSIVVTAVGASATDLGLDTGTSTIGTNVAGTFDGVAGFGIGQVLLPALNTDPSGLSLIVDPGATTSTVTFSGGFGRTLSVLIDTFLGNDGTIETREDSLDSQLDGLDDDQDRLDRRIDAFEARLMAQYAAMEAIISSISSNGGVLDNILDILPFTANNS